jgi:hypothetical protein
MRCFIVSERKELKEVDEGRKETEAEKGDRITE